MSLGRFRQWAGEVISSKDKSNGNEEFRELEKDIELRKHGINRLITASEAYHHALSKKKMNEVIDGGEKLLPIDTLGIVMILHGEEFGEDSPFGNSLVKLGRAHCKIATLQEAYALTFRDTFVTSLERFRDEIKESTSESATTKFEKMQNSKKEKDRREAEEEMERAKQRYEETAEDLRAHMHAIQENEHAQLHELTAFIDVETNFAENYLEVLRDVKADWKSKAESKVHPRSRRGSHSTQILPPSRSATPRINGTNGRHRGDSTISLDSSEDESPPARHPPKHSRTNSNGSKPPSRPASRLSRKRASSNAASVRGGDETAKEKDKNKDKEKEKEKEADKDKDRPRRMSMAGWASSAVESVTGGSKSKKNKDKDSFATLDDELGQQTVGEMGSLGKASSFRALTRRTSSKSKENLPNTTSSSTLDLSSVGSKILKPPSLQERKVVRALYDFSGSSDELSFRAGNEIVVVNEVLDDWWMGEVDGKTGLFPTSYTEVVGTTKVGASPKMSTKLSSKVAAVLNGRRHNQEGSEENGVGNVVDSDNYLTSDAEDHELGAAPMSANKTPVFFGGFHDRSRDSASFTDTATEDESEAQPQVLPNAPQRTWADHDDDWFTEKQPPHQAPVMTQQGSITPKQQRSVLSSLKMFDPAQQPLINRSKSENAEPIPPQRSSPTKKVPPPPPPRRALSSTPAQTPPIPMRRAPVSVAASTSSGSISLLSSTSSLNGRARTDSTSTNGQTYDRSPFESAVELEMAGGKCESFRQNPFKPAGMCSNCLNFHD